MPSPQKPILKQEALRLGLALAAILIVGLMTTSDQTSAPAIAKNIASDVGPNSSMPSNFSLGNRTHLQSKTEDFEFPQRTQERKIASKKPKKGPRLHGKTASPVAMTTPRSTR